MINRIADVKLREYLRQYPVVTVTGPRQSGKTTLCRSSLPDKPYLNLEDRETREALASEPKRFLGRFPNGAVIDEFQRFPELTSALQVIVDEKRTNGLYVLTGSQSFDSMERVSQSLAGRTAFIRLLPFSMEELAATGIREDLDSALFRGMYPRIYDQKPDPNEYYSFYVSTYVERDIRRLINVRDLGTFEVFLGLCAGRTGQLLNMNAIAAECGVSHNTVKSWVSLLESSFIIRLLRPYHANIKKKLTKSPKLYFLDTGLAAYLLGIRKEEQLRNHPLRGALFETFVYTEMVKYFWNRGPDAPLSFFREHNGLEIDFLVSQGARLDAYEVKSAQNVHPDFFRNLRNFRRFVPERGSMNLVYSGDQEFEKDGIGIWNWRNIPSSLDRKERE